MYDLNRFIEAQKEQYSQALNEIKQGHKVGHWMWFIFPQLKGLGQTEISNYYGIENLKEAIEYLKNEYLYNNFTYFLPKRFLSIAFASFGISVSLLPKTLWTPASSRAKPKRNHRAPQSHWMPG